VKRLTLLLALFLPACVNQETVDYAFCDADEACFTSTVPLEVVCGGVKCPSSLCYVNVHCNPEKPSECIGDGYTKDFDDHNACTVETCGADGWEHTPLRPEDLDDGNACTVDQCDVGSGPVHTNTCT
jgi:hypothetical protein